MSCFKLKTKTVLGLHAATLSIVFIPSQVLQSNRVTTHHLLQYITKGKNDFATLVVEQFMGLTYSDNREST